MRNRKLKTKIRALEDPHSMSLVFSLLQKDYIVLAADSRHTRGDTSGGLYKNDRCIKTVEAMHGNAVLGFAGHDRGEHIISKAIAMGILDTAETLSQIAEKFFPFAKQEYELQYPPGTEYPRSVEFLLSGWSQNHHGHKVATAYTYRRCKSRLMKLRIHTVALKSSARVPMAHFTLCIVLAIKSCP